MVVYDECCVVLHTFDSENNYRKSTTVFIRSKNVTAWRTPSSIYAFIVQYFKSQYLLEAQHE